MFIYFFEKKFVFLILFLCIPLLFLPKYNLVSVGSETAGIRVDDLILFIVAIVLVWVNVLMNKNLFKIEVWILILTVFSLFSFVSNHLLVSFGILHTSAHILYTLRLFEYFIFFYVGMFASQLFIGDRIIRLFFLWNIVLMVLQKLNLIGGLSAAGYGEVSTRVQGIASFPSEMGLLLNLLFCYLIYDKSSSSKFISLFPLLIQNCFRKLYLPLMFLIFGAFIVFTGNRISILALLICFLFKLKEEFNWRSVTSLMSISILSGLLLWGISVILMNTESVYERSADLLSMKNIDLVKVVWNNINIGPDAMYEQSKLSSTGYDMSWWLRIHKWMYMTKLYVLTPECYLQGLGPGFAGAALDGGLLRIITEYGVIGSLIFWKFFGCIYRFNQQCKWMIIAFAINMIFFDAYLAYKVMSFLLFSSGYIFGCKQQEKKDLQSSELCN